MDDLSPIDRICQIIERRGICNAQDITYSYFGVRQAGGGKYSPLQFITDEQLKTVQKLIKKGREQGRIEKLGSGRWTQYQIPRRTP